MKFAYADPPYFGCGRLYADRHPDALAWDDLDTHAILINRLYDQFPDGWALSASSASLRAILPLCPSDVRVMAWVKPFASFKPGVNPAYAWEPVIVRGGRPRGRDVPTVRDWVSAVITLQKGCPGAKPAEFCCWLFEVLNLQDGDELHDLFPGSGAVSRAWEAWQSQARLFGGECPSDPLPAATEAFLEGADLR